VSEVKLHRDLVSLHGQSQVQVARRLELLASACCEIVGQAVEEVHFEDYLQRVLLYCVGSAFINGWPGGDEVNR